VYLVYYRHHILNEEREVLPRAKKLITEEEWEAVAAAAPAWLDPLFGNKGDAGYRELRRHILLEAQPD